MIRGTTPPLKCRSLVLEANPVNLALDLCAPQLLAYTIRIATSTSQTSLEDQTRLL